MQLHPKPRAVVVSIHDVSPLTRGATQAILDRLKALGIARCSLLVVPDHHHRGHFLYDTIFSEWLATLGREGHEIVIHGYYHIRERKKTENLWQRLITRAYTADEGEFYDIDEDLAAGLVAQARADFAKLDLHPAGFIAPAWLLSDAGETALRKADFQYTTRLRNILCLASGARHDSMSMVYSVRNAWRRTLSLAWNALLFHRLKSNPLLRVSIHPPDLDHENIWRQIARYIALALEDRAPMTYWNWVSNQTAFHPRPTQDHVQS
jgi:hypothetical protein